MQDDIQDAIETETRTRTRVEANIEEHEETYEVVTCRWCTGEHPVEDTVPLSFGGEQTTTERHVATVTMDGMRSAPPSGVHIRSHDGVRTERQTTTIGSSIREQHVFAEVPAHDAAAVAPTCSYCAQSLAEQLGLDIDIEGDILDEPAVDAYADTDFGEPDAGSPARTVGESITDDVAGLFDHPDPERSPNGWRSAQWVAFPAMPATVVGFLSPLAVMGVGMAEAAMIAAVSGVFGLIAGATVDELLPPPTTLVRRVLTNDVFWIGVMLASVVTMLGGVELGVPTHIVGLVALVQCTIGGMLAVWFEPE